ncbi:TF28 protein, partial [Pseudoatta argentina]
LQHPLNKYKENLANAIILSHLSDAAEMRLVCDASDFAIGAVLEQRLDDSWKPFAFFSRKLSSAQQNYSVYDRELTAIAEAVKYFRYFLEGRNFKIVTDHKPLIYAFMQRSKKASPRQQRQLSFILQFTIPNSMGPMHTILYCEMTGEVIAPIYRHLRVFRMFHDAAHPGPKITDRVIRQRYVWPNMHRDIAKWCKNCLDCQQSNITRHVQLNPEKFIAPDSRFKHVHMDLIGLLPESDGYKYCVANFGKPKTITTDQGSQFEAQLFTALLQLIGCQRIRTTAYYPVSNGIIERWHRSLKAAICHANKGWSRVLSTVLLGLRTHHKHKKRAFVFKDLYSHVFLWVGGTKRALESPYTGLHKIVNHVSDRVFNIDVNGTQRSVSVENLKPAYCIRDDLYNATPEGKRPIRSATSNQNIYASEEKSHLRHIIIISPPSDKCN